MKGLVSARQSAIIASILIFSNKILTLPSLLSGFAKGDAIFILLMMFLADLGVLCLFFFLKNRYKTQSFFEILSSHLTKPVAIIIYIFLFAYFLMKLLLNFNSTQMYFKTQVYHDAHIFIFLFTTIVILATSILGGLRALARTIEFFYIPLIVGLLFCLFISFANINDIPVLFDTSFKSFFTGAFKYTFCFGDFLILFLLMHKIQIDKKWENNFLKYSIFSMSLILVEYGLFFSIFQFTGFLHTDAMSDIIVLSYKFFDIGRLDIIAIITIMLLTFCQIGLYGYAMCEIFNNIVSRLSVKYSCAFVILCFLILYLLFFNSLDFLVEITTIYLPYISILFQYFLPILTIFLRKKIHSEVAYE